MPTKQNGLVTFCIGWDVDCGVWIATVKLEVVLKYLSTPQFWCLNSQRGERTKGRNWSFHLPPPLRATYPGPNCVLLYSEHAPPPPLPHHPLCCRTRLCGHSLLIPRLNKLEMESVEFSSEILDTNWVKTVFVIDIRLCDMLLGLNRIEKWIRLSPGQRGLSETFNHYVPLRTNAF